MKFHTPAAVRAEPESAPANTLGIRRILFAVENIEGIVASLRAHGFELMGELAQVDGGYLFCYVRGHEGTSSPWPNSSAETSDAYLTVQGDR
jgi:hypothetical protein